MPTRGQVEKQWVSIAKDFPATLVKDVAPELLKDGQTPDSYGLGIDTLGYLYSDTSPAGGSAMTALTAVTAPTNTPLSATATWYYWHNRLWGITTAAAQNNYIAYGAPGYKDTYIRQSYGRALADFETSAITAIIPFGKNIGVFKADNLYFISNADSESGNHEAEFVQQGLGVANKAESIAMGGNVYFVNANGVFSFDGQNVAEITFLIRNNLGTFAAGEIDSVYGDFAKKRIMGRASSSTVFIIDTQQDNKLFDYGTSGFRYTTPTFVSDTHEPLIVDKIGLAYKYEAGNKATITYQIKINDKWQTAETFKDIVPTTDNGWIEIPVITKYACRRWTFRITAITASLYISDIMVSLKQGGIRGYSSE